METEAHGSYRSTSYLWMFPILYFFVSLVFDLLFVNFEQYKSDADLTQLFCAVNFYHHIIVISFGIRLSRFKPHMSHGLNYTYST